MSVWHHPCVSRRSAIQAGSIGCMGLSAGLLADLQAAEALPAARPKRSVIYLFLSGGLGQHDSFDMKPEAVAEIRGEFNPISTRTPGVQIVEHLPLLAQRSSMWSLIRSFTHPTNDHSLGHLMMLTGRSKAPPTFNANKPMPQDWPCIASVAGDQLQSQNGLPPSVVLKIVKSDPGVRGDTATNVLKPATLETGATVNVPLFVNEGDRIKVDTRTREYVSRA